MNQLKYLAAYPAAIQSQVQQLLDNNQLASVILKKYPAAHDIKTDKALYDYVLDIKNDYLRKTEPLSKITFDSKIHVINHALGLHTTISRVQGSKLKSKHEIRIASMFKEVPIEFLKMIVVHELVRTSTHKNDNMGKFKKMDRIIHLRLLS